MKNRSARHAWVAAVVAGCGFLSGCDLFDPAVEEEAVADSSGPTGTPSGGTASSQYPCLKGTWHRTVCSSGDARVRFSGGDSGTGDFYDSDCNNQCANYEGKYGRFFEFNYSVTGTNKMQITYTNGGICGSQSVPNGGTQSFSCNSDGTLSFGNTYHR